MSPSILRSRQKGTNLFPYQRSAELSPSAKKTRCEEIVASGRGGGKAVAAGVPTYQELWPCSDESCTRPHCPWESRGRTRSECTLCPYFRARNELSGFLERGIGALPRGTPSRRSGDRRQEERLGPIADAERQGHQVLPLREQVRRGRGSRRHASHGAVLHQQLHGTVVRRRRRQDLQNEQRQAILLTFFPLISGGTFAPNNKGKTLD